MDVGRCTFICEAYAMTDRPWGYRLEAYATGVSRVSVVA
jgi:hypothetical protein